MIALYHIFTPVKAALGEIRFNSDKEGHFTVKNSV
jgi:hypothetical protein